MTKCWSDTESPNLYKFWLLFQSRKYRLILNHKSVNLLAKAEFSQFFFSPYAARLDANLEVTDVISKRAMHCTARSLENWKICALRYYCSVIGNNDFRVEEFQYSKLKQKSCFFQKISDLLWEKKDRDRKNLLKFDAEGQEFDIF